MSLTDDELWSLLVAFIKEEGLVRQHLTSYDEFIFNGLLGIINEVDGVDVEAETKARIKFGKIKVKEPRVVEVDGSEHNLHPIEARIRNLTYAAPVYLEMWMEKEGRKSSPTEEVYIGDIPIMIKSRNCYLYQKSAEELVQMGEDPKDPGNYFIINGSERVVVALEDLAPNRILVDIDDSGTTLTYKAKVFSTTVGFRARIEVKMKSDGSLVVSVPGVVVDLPFVILMKGLGLEADKDIAFAVSPRKDVQDLLEPSFEKSENIIKREDAIKYIGNRVAFGYVEEYRVKKAEGVLNRNFLPHIGRDLGKRMEKTYFLAEIANRIFELKLGMRKVDDKDHYANKRLKLAGDLLGDLFRITFRNLCRDMKYQLERTGLKRVGAVGAIGASIRPGIITERIQHAVATGNWGRGKVGITQLLDRTNYTSTLSHLRRLQSPLSRSQPNFEARDLHSTHWGRLCPNETPEGSNCGLVKNTSLTAAVTQGENPENIKPVILRLGFVEFSKASPHLREVGAKVFLENSFGYVANPEEFVSKFRELRRQGEVHTDVNIAFYENISGKGVIKEIFINCGKGRVRRPLIICENGVSRLTSEHINALVRGELQWSNLVKSGIVEFLDADEEENTYVAMTIKDLTKEHTHLELASYAILGICASLVPFPEHNQSPRNSYEAAMAKQALGVFSSSYINRTDTRSHILHYPQKPLVETRPMEIIGYNERPSGQNAVIAVLSFEGYNMEDALIFNQASVERGLGKSAFLRVYEVESKQYLGGEKDRFENPEAGTRGYRGEYYYRLLEGDGTINVEAEVAGSDVLVGRTSPPRFLEEYKEFELRGPIRRDTSVTMRPSEKGVIDAIFITDTYQGSKIAKIRVRDSRPAELGDKFASRHGQKGVIGMLIPQEDLPFSEEGVVPDIIINPHAFPSRMTIGQFVEALAGKVASKRGSPIDGTPFVNVGLEELKRMMHNLGFHYGGREVLYNGMTGEKLVSDVFMGVIYYQKLHHMVADKMHARARGQVQMLTRQPTEGRARGGGLRFGEMERDCLIGHGAAILLKNRLLDESDKAVVYTCEKCGLISYYDQKQRKYVCSVCREESAVSPVVVSYAFKLLLQELMSMSLAPRLTLEERT